MRKILFLVLFSLVICNFCYAADFAIKWTAPVINKDGTPITDLAGYKIYYGTSSKTYLQPKGSGINVVGASVLTHIVTGLDTDKNYYFAVTAYDTSNNESDYSNEVVGIFALTKIIDNGATGTSYTGTWETSAGTGFYGTNSLYNMNNTNATYTWSFTPSKTGKHEISMWWTYRASRNPSVPVDITHAGGVARVNVNQLDQTKAAKWNVLGTYQFNAGTTYKITITAKGTTSTCADAVRIAYMGVDIIAPGTPTATIYVTQ